MPLARRYLGRYGVRFVTWRRDGELVGVAPFSLVADRPPLRPLRELALWGTIGPRMRGLVDVLARDDARTEVLDGLCAWLRESGEWDVLRVVRPQFESSTPDRLRSEATHSRWRYAGYSNLRSTTYQLDLPADAEGWQKHLGGKTRRTLRWELRKFADFRGGEMVSVVPSSELPDALDAVERLLREKWGDNEVYFAHDPDFRGLVHESVPLLADAGSAWVTVARDETGIRGGLINVAHNGYAMALAVAMTGDTDYRTFSLGKHLFDAGIGEAVRRGCHNYDFLWVGGYKEEYWHAQPRHLESAMVGRGLIGRLAAAALARRA
ncbi:MAG TPA: GNAT family N-acetyltransferase [Candidatus Limnocylindrales bacterium]|nr:GNAT family N-acetyltransferase [Candidatus Limnocylindrales bacterium]